MENGKNMNFAPFWINFIDKNIWQFDYLVRTGNNTRMSYPFQTGYGEPVNLVANVTNHSYCRRGIIFCNPRKNAVEIVVGFSANYYLHTPKRRMRFLNCGKVSVLGFLSASLRRTSAACAGVKRCRTALRSSMRLSISTASFWRVFGHVKTRSSTAFTSLLLIGVVYHKKKTPRRSRRGKLFALIPFFGRSSQKISGECRQTAHKKTGRPLFTETLGKRGSTCLLTESKK